MHTCFASSETRFSICKWDASKMVVSRYNHHFLSGKTMCRGRQYFEVYWTNSEYIPNLPPNFLKGKNSSVLVWLFFSLCALFSLLFIRLFLSTVAKSNLWIVFTRVHRAPLGSLEISADFAAVFEAPYHRTYPVFTVIDGLILCASCGPNLTFNLKIIRRKNESEYVPLVTTEEALLPWNPVCQIMIGCSCNHAVSW